RRRLLDLADRLVVTATACNEGKGKEDGGRADHSSSSFTIVQDLAMVRARSLLRKSLHTSSPSDAGVTEITLASTNKLRNIATRWSKRRAVECRELAPMDPHPYVWGRSALGGDCLRSTPHFISGLVSLGAAERETVEQEHREHD